jgi:hypothetical protein
MKRITIDIDKKCKHFLIFNISKALFKVKKIKLIEIKPSSSKGYHLIIWTKFNYSDEEIFNLRKYLGDDWFRLNMDKQRNFGRETLFYKKESPDILQ